MAGPEDRFPDLSVGSAEEAEVPLDLDPTEDLATLPFEPRRRDAVASVHPAPGRAEWVLGIDLGTTNTAAAVWGPTDERPRSVFDTRYGPHIPSIVSLKNPKRPVVGWEAKNMLLTDPLTTIYGWKRFIGRRERDSFVSRYRDRFPFRIHTNGAGELGAVVGQEIVSFIDIAAMILSEVRLQARALTGENVDACIITVPAHLGIGQRRAVLEAGQRAGLSVQKLLNEPTAASIAMATRSESMHLSLIFDLGGGTFDATLLEAQEGILVVRGTHGDSFLGGIDFDRAVMERLVRVCRDATGLDLTEEPVVAQRVLNASENAKIALSAHRSVRVHVPIVGYDRKGAPVDLLYELTREELEALVAPRIERTVGIVEEMLADG